MAFRAHVFEKVCKLFMLHTISENPVKPVIFENAVKRGLLLWNMLLTKCFRWSIAYSYENLFDEKCCKAVRYIREAGGRVAHGVLLKRMHEPKEVFKQIIETMEENGTITHEIRGLVQV